MSEILAEEQYNTHKAKATAREGQDESSKEEMSEEQLEAEIRRLVIEASGLIYARTAEETNKRWPFEAEIKRPYFHVKPMDMPQLSNWRRYLDFEETEGDVERIRVLYERCLVTCVSTGMAVGCVATTVIINGKRASSNLDYLVC